MFKVTHSHNLRSEQTFWLFLASSGFVDDCQRSSTIDYFFYRVTLNILTSIDNSAGIHWPMVVCLLAAWTFNCICYISVLQERFAKLKQVGV